MLINYVCVFLAMYILYNFDEVCWMKNAAFLGLLSEKSLMPKHATVPDAYSNGQLNEQI